MCGLVGVVSKTKGGLSTRNMEVFDQLLWLDSLRGEDSTGVFCVDLSGNVQILKEASESTTFVKTKEYKEWSDRAGRKGWAVIGHNRKATRGDITDENAHPFWVDDKLILVHNGTMWGDHKQHADVEVDSHAIAHILAEEEDVGKALGKINAAYALIWYDVEKKELRMIRNHHRPLHFMETWDAIYYASESEMLEFVKKRHTLTMEKDKDIYSLKPMFLQQIILNDDRSSKITGQEITTVVESTARVHQPINLYNADEDEYDYLNWHRRHHGSEHYHIPQLPAPEPVKSPAAVIPKAPDSMVGAWAKTMSIDQWEHVKDEYPKNKSVLVSVVDYLSTDETDVSVYAVGKTMDKNALFSTFPIRRQLMEAITSPDNVFMRELKTPVFQIEVDAVTWNKQKTDDVVGRVTLLGVKAKLISDGKTVVQ